ncbi:MAG: toll/interleukin-1 receptor domain-containing protein [Actinomycetota bacterium]
MSGVSGRVYVSYAWGGESERIVNELDAELQRQGITIVRDKRDLGYGGSIEGFMEEIGEGEAIIVVISDKYLRSKNCMFELTEIAHHDELTDRIFPIVLADANIFDPAARIDYLNHWSTKKKELSAKIKELDDLENLHGITEELDAYDLYRDEIAGLTDVLSDMNALTPEMHESSNFSALVDGLRRRLGEDATPRVDGDVALISYRLGGLTENQQYVIRDVLPDDAGHRWDDEDADALLVPDDCEAIVDTELLKLVAGRIVVPDDDPFAMFAGGKHVDLAHLDRDTRVGLCHQLAAAEVDFTWSVGAELIITAETWPVAELVLDGEDVEPEVDAAPEGYARHRLGGLPEQFQVVLRDLLPYDAGYFWADDDEHSLIAPTDCTGIVNVGLLKIIAGDLAVDPDDPFAHFDDGEDCELDHWDRDSRVELSGRLAAAGVTFTWHDDNTLTVVAAHWPVANEILDDMT